MSNKARTVEQATADLKTVVAEFFAEVEKRISLGDDFDLALMTVCKNRPDLVDRENQLRAYMKALGMADESIPRAAGTSPAVTAIGGGNLKREIWETTEEYSRRQAAVIVAATRTEGAQVNNDWDTVQVEFNRRVKETMAAKGLDYAKAFRALTLDDRDLCDRYQDAKNRELSGGTYSVRPIDASNAEVNAELHPLVQQKVAASEGRMGYGAAFKAVLCERPDLARRLKAGLR